MNEPIQQPPSKTPRTDATAFTVWTKEYGNIDVVPIDEAMQMETKLAEMTAKYASAKAELESVTKERDELQQTVKENGAAALAALGDFTLVTKERDQLRQCVAEQHRELAALLSEPILAVAELNELKGRLAASRVRIFELGGDGLSNASELEPEATDWPQHAAERITEMQELREKLTETEQKLEHKEV